MEPQEITPVANQMLEAQGIVVYKYFLEVIADVSTRRKYLTKD